MTRVLIAADFFPPAIGGLEKHAERLALALRDRGHTVEVVTLATPDNPDSGQRDAMTVHRVRGWSHRIPGAHLDPNRPFPLPTRDPGLVAELQKVIRTFSPDIVHVHGWMTGSVAAAARTHHTRVVATLHDSGFVCPKRTLYHLDVKPCDGPKLTRCLPCATQHYGTAKGAAITGLVRSAPRWLRHVDRFLPVASTVGDVTQSLAGLSTIPFEVIPNFIDLDGVPAETPERPAAVPAERPYVLFVGTLGRFKGVHALIDVWDRYAPDAELVLLGTEAPDTPISLPADVSMYFNVPHDDVIAAFANCEFSVLPSQFPEPSPTVLLEPMALGRPVIASAIGGIPDLVEHEVSGVLVPPLDNDALGEAIVDLLADDDKRDRLGQNSLVRSRRFGLESTVDRIVQAYDKTLGGPNSQCLSQAPQPT